MWERVLEVLLDDVDLPLELEDEDEEDDDEDEDEELPSRSSPRYAMSSVRPTRSGLSSRITASHLALILGRPFRVWAHTREKDAVDAKFCVTAIVVSRFRMACHQPPGTKTVSPGPCMHGLAESKYFLSCQ